MHLIAFKAVLCAFVYERADEMVACMLLHWMLKLIIQQCHVTAALMCINQVKSVGMLVDGLLNAQSMKDNLCAYTDGKKPDHAYLEV